MKITLNPCPVWHTSKISVNELTITIDNIDYDLSVIPEGGQAEPTENSPFIGVVTRDEVTIQYCYDSSKAEPHQSTNWGDYTFEIENGEVPCPIRWLPKPEISEVSKISSYYEPLLHYTGGRHVSEEH